MPFFERFRNWWHFKKFIRETRVYMEALPPPPITVNNNRHMPDMPSDLIVEQNPRGVAARLIERYPYHRPREAFHSQQPVSPPPPPPLECSICMEPLPQQRTTLLCAHTFCTACITQWEAHQHNTCPVCRTPIPEVITPTRHAPQLLPIQVPLFAEEDHSPHFVNQYSPPSAPPLSLMYPSFE